MQTQSPAIYPEQPTNKAQRKTESLQSKVIDFLRFPLIIGVIFIHNQASSVAVSGQTIGTEDNHLPVYTVCTHLVVILSRVAVPLFFFMSGFLFFFQVESFTTHEYVKKLKSRFRTLLIPYLFWNSALLLLMFILAGIPSLSGFMNKKPEWNVSYILSAFWSGNGTLPISYQFWFIRDLMVTVLISPLIYIYIKFLRWPSLIPLAALWYYGYNFPFAGVSMLALFFFTAGGWFSLNRRNLVPPTGKISPLLYTYPVIVIADLLTEPYVFHPVIHNTGILVGIFFWFQVAGHLLYTGKVRVNRFLAQSSFFLFAVHEPLLTILKKILFATCKPQSDVSLTFLFFFVVIIVVAISLLLCFILDRTLPRFKAIITGGR